MARDPHSHDRLQKAHSVFVRLVFPAYTVHFKSPTYMRDATLDLLDKKVCKETLKSTAQDALIRLSIGTDAKFWAELVVLFKAAIPSLERRSFTIWDPSSVDYESTSGALIASNYPGLWKDLERLNDLVSISRNVLTIGTKAQDLAADHAIDTEIFRLINCCVRVTARGYDGDAGTGEEEKWQWIVNAYKKLLITSLQFLNNFVAQNERRKLLLWVALFDQSSSEGSGGAALAPEDIPETSRTSLADVPSNPTIRPEPPISDEDISAAYGITPSTGEPLNLTNPKPLSWVEEYDLYSTPLPQHVQDAIAQAKREPSKSSQLLKSNGYVFFGRHTRDRTTNCFQTLYKRDPTLPELHFELARRWGMEMRDQDREYWNGLYEDAAAKYRADAAVWEAKIMVARLEKRKEGVDWRSSARLGPDAFPTTPVIGQDLQHRPVVPDDLKMLFTAAAGTRILESGKSELLKRLEGYAPPDPNLPPSRNPDGITTRPVHRGPDGLEIERTRTMSRSPDFSGEWRRRHPEGPRNKGEVEEWVKFNEGRSRSEMRALPLPVPRETVVQADKGEREVVLQPIALPKAPTGNGVASVLDEEIAAEHQAALDQEDDELEPDEEESVADDEGEAPNVAQVDEEDDEDEEEEEEDEEEEDYPGSTEDGRGLLTDVPLILGPSEIEVLPMLIMSGIVPPPPHQARPTPPSSLDPDAVRNALTNMHTIRTHLLLSQSNGRNLLRELLIFVAAWDLREEELYFKFMVKIMEGILAAGLMGFAYHAFRDRSRSKDIISPAQAVIMKLLTCIFRGRGEGGKGAAGKQAGTVENQLRSGKPAAGMPEYDGNEDIADDEFSRVDEKALLARRKHLAALVPSRTDLHILNFIFTEFRQHIIPQTCALIFLQGQIRAGRASPEDFPLNLWDMERMYEGVYQYLEFFAVLTEEGVWKGVLAEWECASELVTLLRELEGGGERGTGLVQLRYGRGGAIGMPAAASSAAGRRVGRQGPVVPQQQPSQRSVSADAAIPATQQTAAQHPPAVAVERPFDFDASAPAAMADTTLPPLPLHPPPSLQANQAPIFEAETPLAYPEDPIAIAGAATATTAAHAHTHVHAAGDLMHPAHPAATHLPAAVDQDEPSDFEWRNLKKLAVLVLSSLIWKNGKVQAQVRRYGGLEALVSCCRHDENNPYIREHAIMCLRFAVEGCKRNGDVVRGMARSSHRGRGVVAGSGLVGGSVTLAAQQAEVSSAVGEGGARGLEVPLEVLDTSGYETFMDGKGQVGLRRKEGGLVPGGGQGNAHAYTAAAAAAATGPSLSATAGASNAINATSTVAPGSTMPVSGVNKHPPLPRLSATKMTAEKAAELMQNALRDLPLGDKLVTDRQKAEALAKLDRAFESTEKVLGRGRGGAGNGGGGGASAGSAGKGAGGGGGAAGA